jgi:glycine oxidase
VQRSSDVLVIGSGIIGCAVAYELGRRGVSVLVIDDRQPGHGATQASAGMLAPYNEVDEEGPHLELTVRALDRFDPFIAAVMEDSGVAVRYCRTGTLTLAFTADSRRRLERVAALTRARGVRAELLDAGDVAREEPAAASGVQAGLLIPAHGYVAAHQFVDALVAAGGRRGVSFETGPRAHSIRQEGERVVVSTGAETLTAAYVIHAAGSWAGQLVVEGALGAPVHPVRGQLLHVKAMGSNVRRVTWGDRCYLVPWDDGSLLVGATSEHVGFDEATTVGGMSDLLSGVASTLRSSWRATLVGARAGLRPGTPDDLPIVGPSTVAPRVWYATGHYRNGVLLAPITASLLADALLQQRADPLLEAIHPGRFGRL